MVKHTETMIIIEILNLVFFRAKIKSSRLNVFSKKSFPKKITGKHPFRSLISIKLQSNLLHIFRTPFPKNTFGGLLLFLPCLTKIINDSRQVKKLFKCKNKILQYPLLLEFAKLHASRSFAPYAPLYLTCFTRLRAFVPYASLCLTCLRALRAFAPYGPYSRVLSTSYARLFHSPCTLYLWALKSF